MKDIDEGVVSAGLGCLILTLWATWWSAIIYVAIHFIRKVW